MAILARRWLQDLVGDLPVPPTLLQTLVSRLNVPGKESLEAEWELLILSGLSRAGTIEYEPRLGGPANIDLRFTSPSGLRFSGEITAVSDDELSRQSPVDDLVRETMRRFDKRHVRGSISLRVGATYRSGALRLLLPAPHEFAQHIFNRDFNEFLGRIGNAPNVPQTFSARDTVTEVVIGYSPGLWRMSITYAPFKQPRDIIRNVFYNRLKRKVDQIKRAGHNQADGLAGIIVCDADCELLHAHPGMTVSFESIARHFLKKTEHLDFIAGISVNLDYSSGEHFKPYAFEVRVIDREPDREGMITELIQGGLQHLPRPIRTPTMARYCLDTQHKAGVQGLQYYDRVGASMGHEQISISARAAIEYIAGVIDRQRFEILTDGWMLQNLRRALDGGATVHSMCVRRNPDRDDDSLDIRWRGRDPAASPFTAEHTRP
jgi:hypothetical protein